jgi:hypothetical protein
MKMYIFALGRTGALYVSPFLEVVIGRSCSGCVKDILGAVGGCSVCTGKDVQGGTCVMSSNRCAGTCVGTCVTHDEG